MTALTTLENFKAVNRVPGTTDDGLLEQIIDRVSSWIESQTGRKFKARNYNNDNDSKFSPLNIDSEDYLYFDGDNAVDSRRTIFLPQFPIQRPAIDGALAVELSTLTNRTTGADGAGDTWSTDLLEGRDYVVDYERGIIRLNGGQFVCGMKNYRLTCTAGYKIGDNQPFIPDDVEQLCIELGNLIWKDKQNLQSESIGTWSRTFNTNKSDPFVEDTLTKYTRLSTLL